MSDVVVPCDVNATKPLSDKKDYRLVVLPSGLRAMLISEPASLHGASNAVGQATLTNDADMGDNAADDYGASGSHDGSSDCSDSRDEGEGAEEVEEGGNDGEHGKNAAIALAVAVGSWEDPPHVQGLAHFLEHMLFMGSEKYPQENALDSFLSEHGGSTNAHTEREYTCYEVDVLPAYLYGALDRIAQCIIAPLWKEDAVERELEAIESEFERAKSSDSARQQELLYSFAKEGHPMRTFTWGNRKSLQTDPAAAGVDVRGELTQFYTRHYLPQRMHLVVRGTQSLDELQSMVVECFSSLKVSREPTLPLSYEMRGLPFGETTLVFMKSIKQQPSLCLTWALPPTVQTLYRATPDDHLSHLLGHESKGSVLSALKDAGFASALSAGSDSLTTNSTMFIVSITLTDLGLDRWQDVVTTVFQYIAMLKAAGPQEWVFEELRDASLMEYNFGQDVEPVDQAVDLATTMATGVRAEDILNYPVVTEWKPDVITQFLNMMTPQRVHIDVASPKFAVVEGESTVLGVVLDREEKHFGTRYTVGSLSDETLTLWSKPPVLDSLHLPHRNPFMPSDFTVKSCAVADGGALTYPRLIVGQPFSRLWHKQDDVFKLPQSQVYLFLYSKSTLDDPSAIVLAELFGAYVADALNEVVYMASTVNLSCSIAGRARTGLEVTCSGFNHKLPDLMRTVIEKLVEGEVDPARFQLVKESLIQVYDSALLKPLAHCVHQRSQMLSGEAISLPVLRECLLASTVEDLAKYRRCSPVDASDATDPRFWRDCVLQLFVHGNETIDDCKSLYESIVKHLPPVWPSSSTSPVTLDTLPFGSIIDLKPFTGCILRTVPAVIADESNSVVDITFELGLDETNLRTCASLLSDIMTEKLFDTLRTKEQLGYSVSCDYVGLFGMLTFYVRVQSAKYKARFLHDRIIRFLTEFREYLAAMDESRFANFRKGLISRKLQPDTNLSEESSRHWGEIKARRYEFDYLIKETDFATTLSRDDFLAFYVDRVLGGDSGARRMLATWITSADSAPVDVEPPADAIVVNKDADLAAFRATQAYYRRPAPPAVVSC